MDKKFLLDRLQQEQTELEHPQALDRFLRETEYLREKPERRRFSGRQARWIIALLGASLVAFAAFSLLH